MTSGSRLRHCIELSIGPEPLLTSNRWHGTSVTRLTKSSLTRQHTCVYTHASPRRHVLHVLIIDIHPSPPVYNAARQTSSMSSCVTNVLYVVFMFSRSHSACYCCFHVFFWRRLSACLLIPWSIPWHSVRPVWAGPSVVELHEKWVVETESIVPKWRQFDGTFVEITLNVRRIEGFDYWFITGHPLETALNACVVDDLLVCK